MSSYPQPPQPPRPLPLFKSTAVGTLALSPGSTPPSSPARLLLPTMEARPLQPSPAAARHLAGDNTALDDLRGILLTNGERVVLVPMPSEWMTLCQLAAYTFSFDLRTHYPAFYLQLPHTSYHQQQLNEAEIPPLAFRSLKERDVVRVEVLARGGEERVVEGGNGEGEGMLGLLGAVEGVGEEEGMLGLVGALEGVGGDEERMLGLDRAVIGGDGDGEGLPGLDRAIEDLLNSGLARGEEGEEEDRRVENVERLSSSEESQMRRVHADGDGERRADDASQVQQVPISNVGGPEEGNSDNNKEDADLGKEVIVEIEAAPAQSMDTAMGTSADGSSTAATIVTGDKEGEKDREGGDKNRGDADRDRGKEVIVEIEVAPQQPMEATMSTSAQGSSTTAATAATAGASTATGGNNEGEDGEKVPEDVDNTNNKNITPPTQQNATSATKKPRTGSSTGIKTTTKKASASASVGTSARKSKRLMRKPATTTTTTEAEEQADQVPSVSMSSPSKKGIDGMPLGRPPAEAGKRRTYDEKRKLAVRSRSLKGKQALSGESSSAAAIGGGGEVGLDSGKGFKSRADGTTRMMDGSGSGVVENSDDGEEEEVEMGLEGQF